MSLSQTAVESLYLLAFRSTYDWPTVENEVVRCVLMEMMCFPFPFCLVRAVPVMWSTEEAGALFLLDALVEFLTELHDTQEYVSLSLTVSFVCMTTTVVSLYYVYIRLFPLYYSTWVV